MQLLCEGRHRDRPRNRCTPLSVLEMEDVTPNLTPLSLHLLRCNSSVPHLQQAVKAGVSHLTHFQLDAAFCFPSHQELTLEHRCVTNKMFRSLLLMMLPERPAGLTMGGPDTRDMVRNRGSSQRQRREELKMQKVVCFCHPWRKQSQTHDGHSCQLVSTRSSWAASVNHKGWDKPQTSCLPGQWKCKFMGKAIVAAEAIFKPQARSRNLKEVCTV